MIRKQNLIGIRNLIANGWCRGEAHKQIRGKDHYCLYGAAEFIINDPVVRYQTLDYLVPSGRVGQFNDSFVDKRSLLRWFDKKIAECTR